MSNPLNIYDFFDIRRKIKSNPVQKIREFLELDNPNPYRFHLTESLFIGALGATVSYFWSRNFTKKLIYEYVDQARLSAEFADQTLSFLKTQSAIFSWFAPLLLVFSGFMSSLVFRSKSSELNRVETRRGLLFYHGSYGLFPAMMSTVLFVIMNEILFCGNILMLQNPNITMSSKVDFIPEIVMKHASGIMNDPFKLSFFIITEISAIYLLYLYLVKAPIFVSKLQGVKYGLGKYLAHAFVWSISMYACFAFFFVGSILVSGTLIYGSTSELSSWQKYTSSDEKFSVQMPVRPKEEHVNMISISNEYQAPMRAMGAETDRGAFYIYWMTHSSMEEFMSDLFFIYENRMKRKEAVMVSKDEVSDYEHLYVFDLPGDSTLTSMLYFNNHTFYDMEVITSDRNKDQPLIDKFMHSFQVLKKD